MQAVVAAFNQEKALVGAFSVIVQPIVEPMEHYTALIRIPREVAKQGYGYLEDRRPSSNCDPYVVTGLIVKTTCLPEASWTPEKKAGDKC